MQQTFSINLKTDSEDYKQVEVDEINSVAKRSAERDPFLDELKRVQYAMSACELKERYRNFITAQEERYVDWSDCIFDDSDWLIEEGTFRCNNYDYYYFPDDPYGDTVFDDFPGALFVNSDAHYVEEGKYFVDKNGNKHNSPYFRYTEISKYKDLDARLLIAYANYFLEVYGFAEWFHELSDDQLDFIKRHTGKLNLTQNQKYVIAGDLDVDLWDINEEYLKKIRLIEQSPDLADKTYFEFKSHPFTGFFMKKVPEYRLSRIDVTKIDQETFDYLIGHFWELLSSIKKECEIRILAEYLSDDENFSWNKMTSIKPPQHISFSPSTWDASEIINCAKALSLDSAEITDRIEIVKKFLVFEAWFKQNRVANYRNANYKTYSSYWTLESAYHAVKNPASPRLCVENTMHNQARLS